MTANGSLFLDWHTDDGATSHLLVLLFDYDGAPVSGICRGILDGIAGGTRSVVDGLAHFLLLGLGVFVGQHALFLPSRAASFLPTLLLAGLLFGALAALFLLENAFGQHATGQPAIDFA